jgi:large subunit ribosomal protein L6
MTTSRVGRKPVAIPAGVDIKVMGSDLHVKGPKGQEIMPMNPAVSIQIENGLVMVSSNDKAGYCRSGSGSRLRKSITGTTRAKIANLVFGVSSGFERKLTLVGVGYRAQVAGKMLNLTLGYSHPVSFSTPEGITIETPSQTEVLIKGTDKHLVGHVAAMIRAMRSPEPYKGKGIRYAKEVIVLKETKKK